MKRIGAVHLRTLFPVVTALLVSGFLLVSCRERVRKPLPSDFGCFTETDILNWCEREGSENGGLAAALREKRTQGEPEAALIQWLEAEIDFAKGMPGVSNALAARLPLQGAQEPDWSNVQRGAFDALYADDATHPDDTAHHAFYYLGAENQTPRYLRVVDNARGLAEGPSEQFAWKPGNPGCVRLPVPDNGDGWEIQGVYDNRWCILRYPASVGLGYHFCAVSLPLRHEGTLLSHGQGVGFYFAGMLARDTALLIEAQDGYFYGLRRVYLGKSDAGWERVGSPVNISHMHNPVIAQHYGHNSDEGAKRRLGDSLYILLEGGGALVWNTTNGEYRIIEALSYGHTGDQKNLTHGYGVPKHTKEWVTITNPAEWVHGQAKQKEGQTGAESLIVWSYESPAWVLLNRIPKEDKTPIEWIPQEKSPDEPRIGIHIKHKNLVRLVGLTPEHLLFLYRLRTGQTTEEQEFVLQPVTL